MNRTHFLNVDLDLRGANEGEMLELVRAFGSAVIVLTTSGSFTSLELAEAPASIDDAIAAFARLVVSLPAAVRASWDRCELRAMNAGIQAGEEPFSEVFVVSTAAINVLKELGATLKFTVYSR